MRTVWGQVAGNVGGDGGLCWIFTSKKTQGKLVKWEIRAGVTCQALSRLRRSLRRTHNIVVEPLIGVVPPLGSGGGNAVPITATLVVGDAGVHARVAGLAHGLKCSSWHLARLAELGLGTGCVTARLARTLPALCTEEGALCASATHPAVPQ